MKNAPETKKINILNLKKFTQPNTIFLLTMRILPSITLFLCYIHHDASPYFTSIYVISRPELPIKYDIFC
jgi:hypothetical protein